MPSPNMLQAFRSFYKERINRGGFWVKDTINGGWYLDRSEEARKAFLSKFSKEEQKIIREGERRPSSEAKRAKLKAVVDDLLSKLDADELRALKEEYR